MGHQSPAPGALRPDRGSEAARTTTPTSSTTDEFSPWFRSVLLLIKFHCKHSKVSELVGQGLQPGDGLRPLDICEDTHFLETTPGDLACTPTRTPPCKRVDTRRWAGVGCACVHEGLHVNKSEHDCRLPHLPAKRRQLTACEVGREVQIRATKSTRVINGRAGMLFEEIVAHECLGLLDGPACTVLLDCLHPDEDGRDGRD
jgi:hypothetical protein